jgi:hypothetical protein
MPCDPVKDAGTPLCPELFHAEPLFGSELTGDAGEGRVDLEVALKQGLATRFFCFSDRFLDFRAKG